MVIVDKQLVKNRKGTLLSQLFVCTAIYDNSGHASYTLPARYFNKKYKKY